MVFIEDLVREAPPVTRVLCGGSILLHLLIHIQAITKYDVYFNLDLITSKFQVLAVFVILTLTSCKIWRFFTNIVYFEDMHIVTFFCILFLYAHFFLCDFFLKELARYRCSKKLEQQIFKNNIADYLFFLLTGITVMTVRRHWNNIFYLIILIKAYGIYMGFTNLSKPFLTMLLYLWSRYNRNAVFLVLGIFPIKAPYITWYFAFKKLELREYF